MRRSSSTFFLMKLSLAVALVALAGCADLDVWFYHQRMDGDAKKADEKARRPAAVPVPAGSTQRVSS